MGAVQDAINLAFRDFVTEGVPASGAHEPRKLDIRAVGSVIEQLLAVNGLDAIYENASAGITATTNGDLFLVKGSGETFADLYKNNAGGAVAQNISLPSSVALVRAFRAGTLAEREAIPTSQRVRGFQFLVTDIMPWRTFEWRLAGDLGGPMRDGEALGSNQWVGLYTPAENLTSEQQAALTRVQSAVLTAEDYGERFSKFPTPDYGDRVIVKNAFQIGGIWHSREFEWRQAGSLDLLGDPISEDGWMGLRTANELANIENLTLGNLDLDRVNGAIPRLDAADAGIATLGNRLDFVRMRVDSFSVTPSQAEVGDTITSLDFAWARSGGVPNGQVIERDGVQRVWWLKGSDTSAIALAAGAMPAGLLVIGDSQSYDKWEVAYAAALGLTLVRCAVYAQTSRKQALRVGAYDLTVTLAGNSLPAAGTQGTVTAMNGGPTTIANPDAILHAHTGDTATHVIDGLLAVSGGTAHVRLTHAAGSAADIVTVARLDGGGAVTVTAGALFVPDYKAMLAGTHRVAIMVGHNSMSGSDPVGSFAGIRADIDAIMALRGNNIVELNAIFPADTPAERALIPHIVAFNQWLRDKYPGAIMLLNGRDLYQHLLFEGGTSEVVTAAYRADDLHLNSTGNGKWQAFQQAAASAQFAGVVPLTASATFVLRARGAVPGYPAVEETRTVAIPFLHRRYWGVSGSATLNSAGVVGLGGTDLSSNRAKTATVTAADQYVYVAYPAEWGDPASYKLFGFNEPPTKTTVSVTKSNGATVSYIVLRSPLKLTGPVSVEVQ